MKMHKRLVIVSAALLVLAILMGGCAKDESAGNTTEMPMLVEVPSDEEPREEGSAAESDETESAEDEADIQTQYMQLSIPETYLAYVEHREVEQDEIAMEIFTLTSGQEELELFRFYFGDDTVGTLVGYLTIGEEEIPVSYALSEYNNEFSNEETKASYYSAMELFSHILNDISEYENFSQSQYVAPAEEKRNTMTYFAVELPESIIWEEKEQDGLYCVDFYWTFDDEMILLYSVGFGEMESDYSVGDFAVDGEKRTVNVKIYELPVDGQWTDEEISMGYRMLETVNDVIDAIMSDENFSEEVPA